MAHFKETLDAAGYRALWTVLGDFVAGGGQVFSLREIRRGEGQLLLYPNCRWDHVKTPGGGGSGGINPSGGSAIVRGGDGSTRT